MGIYYLIRHGVTRANKEGVLQGHLDVPLSELGEKEAELAGRALSGVKLDAVYSSDLSRAKGTALAIVKHQGCKLVLDRRLRELHCGLLQGLTVAQSRERFPEFFRALKEDPMKARRPGGECYQDLYERSVRALEDIYRNYPDGTVAIVSHGGVIRCLLAHAAGGEVDPASPAVGNGCINVITERYMEEIRRVGIVANGSISVITRDGNGWHVQKVNDVEHLRSLVDAEELKDMADTYRWEA